MGFFHPKKPPMEAAGSLRATGLILAHTGPRGGPRHHSGLKRAGLVPGFCSNFTFLFFYYKKNELVYFFPLPSAQWGSQQRPSLAAVGRVEVVMLRTWRVFFLCKHPCEKMVQLFPAVISCWGLYLAGGAGRTGTAHPCHLPSSVLLTHPL